MPACSFGIWILFLHVNRSIRMKTDENSLYLGPFHRRKPPAENASLHACRAHDNHLPPLAAFVRRQCGGFRRAALRWAGAPGRRRRGGVGPRRGPRPGTPPPRAGGGAPPPPGGGAGGGGGGGGGGGPPGGGGGGAAAGGGGGGPPPPAAPALSHRFHRRQKGSEKPGPTLYGAGHTNPW